MTLDPVRVRHRTGRWCPGVRTGDGMVAYDVQLDLRWQIPGRPTRDRCYLLPAEGVQLTRPVTFVDALEGAWYVDIVIVEELGPDELAVRDLYVDLIIPPAAHRYEVLDFDELADALDAESISVADAVTALRQAQAFVDRRLRTLEVDEPASWPDFPPAGVDVLTALPPFAIRPPG